MIGLPANERKKKSVQGFTQVLRMSFALIMNEILIDDDDGYINNNSTFHNKCKKCNISISNNVNKNHNHHHHLNNYK